jgi:hypothetical protein
MFNSSRQVREQSLSHRGVPIEAPEAAAAAGKKSWGPAIMKYGKEFLIGTGATMAFAYAFEKLNGSGGSKASSTPSTTSATSGSPNTAYPTSTDPTSNYPTSTDPTSNYPTSTDPTSNYPTYSTSTYPTTQTNGYQQRAVDRELPADIFGEPHLESWFIDSIADGIVIISGFSEARSSSDNNNQNRRGAN